MARIIMDNKLISEATNYLADMEVFGEKVVMVNSEVISEASHSASRFIRLQQTGTSFIYHSLMPGE